MSSCPTCGRSYKAGSGGVCQNCARAERERKKFGRPGRSATRHKPPPPGLPKRETPNLDPPKKSLSREEMANISRWQGIETEASPRPLRFGNATPEPRKTGISKSYSNSAGPDLTRREAKKKEPDTPRTYAKNRLRGLTTFIEILYGRKLLLSQLLAKQGIETAPMQKLKNPQRMARFLRKLTAAWSALVQARLPQEGQAVLRFCSLKGQSPEMNREDWRRLGLSAYTGPQRIRTAIIGLRDRIPEFEGSLARIAQEELK